VAVRYVHTNLIAKNWRRLAQFYQDVFGCLPIPPERDLSGEWLDNATGLKGVHITGQHLRLPGYGDSGPTLEIFRYDDFTEKTAITPNATGFAHIAFAVDNVPATAQAVIDHGGSSIGNLTEREVPAVGRLTFRYMADPEGNIIEIQRWQKSSP
jgi:predicted enzyme related to lactoylglutathione lyase